MNSVPEPVVEQRESDDEFFESLFPDPPDPFPECRATLKQTPNWIQWKLEERDGKQTKGALRRRHKPDCRNQQPCGLGSVQDRHSQRLHDQRQRRSRLCN